MKSRRLFRLIWKLNAVLILVLGTGVFCGLLIGSYGLIKQKWNWMDPKSLVASVRPTESQLDLGEFRRVDGTAYLVAPLLTNHYLKEKRLIRNYLFVNADTQASHWLAPNHDSLMIDMEELSVSGLPTRGSGEAKWLVFTLVVKDSDGDSELTHADRKSIGVAEADGTNYVEVLQNVDRVHGKSGMTGGRLHVLHSSDGKNLVTEIDMVSRRLAGTRALAGLR